jgi:hypothetical protein
MALFTELLGLVKQETAENELLWGSVLETSFIDLADEAIAGLADVDVTSGDHELTDEQGVSTEARHMIVRFFGTPVLGLTITVPQRQKLYIFDNDCGQVVTVKTGTGISIDLAVGETTVCVVDADLNQVFKVPIHDLNIVARIAADAAMDPFPCTIDIDAGTETPVIYELVEGQIASYLSLQTTFTMTAASATGFIWTSNSGQFTDSQKEQGFAIFVRDDAVVVRMFVSITPNTFVFTMEDPAITLAASSVLTIPSFQFTQSIAPNP